MCFGGGAPSAPNTSQQSGASSAIGSQAQQAGANQLNWAQGQTAQNTANTANAQSTLNSQAQGQFGAGNAAAQNFTQNTLPAAQQNMQFAQNWGSPAGVASAQANAAATTGQAYDAARMNNQRQLASYGVDPSTLKSSFANLQGNLAQAGAVGNATYNAGQQRQLQGFGMTGQAIGQGAQLAGVGQGYTGQGAGMTSSGVQLGNQSLATNSGALSAPSTMMQTGLQGYGQSANIQNQSFQNQLASYNAQNQGVNSLMSGLGSAAGMAGMLMMSDGGPIGGARGFMPKLQTGMPRMGAAHMNLVGGVPGKPPHFADGGIYVPIQSAPSVAPVAIQQGATFDDPNAGGFGKGLQKGAQMGAVKQMQRPATAPGVTPGGTPVAGGASPTPGGDGPAPAPINGDQMQAAAGNTMNAANGGRVAKGIPQRKKQPKPNDAPDQNMAQNPAQQSSPGMGDAGPMTFANGGMPNINPNPLRMQGVPQPKPMNAHHIQYADGGMFPMPEQHQHPFLQQGRSFADGGLPGATWSMGGVADGGSAPGPGMIQHGPSDGTGIDDQVHAKVSVGEYIIPADVVHAKGKEFFDKLLSRYHTPAEQQKQQMGGMR